MGGEGRREEIIMVQVEVETETETVIRPRLGDAPADHTSGVDDTGDLWDLSLTLSLSLSLSRARSCASKCRSRVRRRFKGSRTSCT